MRRVATVDCAWFVGWEMDERVWDVTVFHQFPNWPREEERNDPGFERSQKKRKEELAAAF